MIFAFLIVKSVHESILKTMFTNYEKIQSICQEDSNSHPEYDANKIHKTCKIAVKTNERQIKSY